jgi:hypothetical protein
VDDFQPFFCEVMARVDDPTFFTPASRKLHFPFPRRSHAASTMVPLFPKEKQNVT